MLELGFEYLIIGDSGRWQRTGRRYIGVDINAEYLELSLHTRLRNAALDFEAGA